MRNPKLAPGRSNWYRYYAGYSLDFARDVAESLELPMGAHALDPWSGSGTTVVAFAERGVTCTGVDANPALVIVGRGRLLPTSVRHSLAPIANGIVEIARESDYVRDGDPLSKWFHEPTALRLRRLEWALQHLLVSHVDYVPVCRTPRLSQLSNLAAFYYVALFEVVRELARPFRSSNPTWVTPPEVGLRAHQTWEQLVQRFSQTVDRLAGGLAKPSVGTARARVRVGNSTSLELEDNSVDAVVASPPYCTRLDYVVSTRTELALLGLGDSDVRALRARMIGTPTVHAPQSANVPDSWGVSVKNILGQVASHESKASSTYYRNTYWQYFDGMARSLAEVRRVLRPGGRAVLVVQDSRYKDIHVDLPSLLSDMATLAGLKTISRMDFAGKGTWARLNPRSRRYGDVPRPLEAVLTLGT